MDAHPKTNDWNFIELSDVSCSRVGLVCEIKQYQTQKMAPIYSSYMNHQCLESSKQMLNISEDFHNKTQPEGFEYGSLDPQ